MFTMRFEVKNRWSTIAEHQDPVVVYRELEDLIIEAVEKVSTKNKTDLKITSSKLEVD